MSFSKDVGILEELWNAPGAFVLREGKVFERENLEELMLGIFSSHPRVLQRICQIRVENNTNHISQFLC